MKLSYALIIVMLLHSFFSCAKAVGHVDDPLHSVDSVFDSDHNLSNDIGLLCLSATAQNNCAQVDRQAVSHSDSQFDSHSDTEQPHQHTYHAHVSCFIGYQIGLSPITPMFSHNNRLTVQRNSLTHQPPVPPPNHDFSI
ncbi:hypothetical protein [Idiomarina xiamenensis]|uniref:Uncharacterized protein n=1 Tax=Idiomarina xiamenensis 10-D-4 TaxID=740709 RepID=K2JHN6_9GAMM|nr:hypothetical protein [Idiomarina xiamenensis]EKE82891.1 hypothetical protein A10D4_08629 [Idiomarina xiamenensis 10-D-4]